MLPDVPLPDAETPSPLGPTSDSDPPPALPYSLSMNLRGSGQQYRATVPLRRVAAPKVSTNDPPPAPPWEQSASL